MAVIFQSIEGIQFLSEVLFTYFSVNCNIVLDWLLSAGMINSYILTFQ